MKWVIFQGNLFTKPQWKTLVPDVQGGKIVILIYCVYEKENLERWNIFLIGIHSMLMQG